MNTDHEGFRDRIFQAGCADCAAYTEIITPVHEETTVTVFHDSTCPTSDWADGVRHAIKPVSLPHWPEQ